MESYECVKRDPRLYMCVHIYGVCVCVHVYVHQCTCTSKTQNSRTTGCSASHASASSTSASSMVSSGNFIMAVRNLHVSIGGQFSHGSKSTEHVWKKKNRNSNQNGFLSLVFMMWAWLLLGVTPTNRIHSHRNIDAASIPKLLRRQTCRGPVHYGALILDPR
jgi:hypothetical protein